MPGRNPEYDEKWTPLLVDTKTGESSPSSQRLADAGISIEGTGYYPGLDVELAVLRGAVWARAATAKNLKRIPERRAQAFILRYWGGLDYRELADRMGVSYAAARILVTRARKSLARVA